MYVITYFMLEVCLNILYRYMHVRLRKYFADSQNGMGVTDFSFKKKIKSALES